MPYKSYRNYSRYSGNLMVGGMDRARRALNAVPRHTRGGALATVADGLIPAEEFTAMTAADGRIFQYALHVPYAHTDQMRFVYYANYLVYFEMARSAMLREVGLPYAELEKKGVFLPVVEVHCVYKAPAHFDDELKVASRCALEGPRLRVTYEVTRGDTVIVTGYTVHVCLSAAGKVMRPAPELRRLVAP